MREQARLAKDWGLADTIRDRLSAAGVTLFDKTNAWRTQDGHTGRIPTWTEIEAGQTAESLITDHAQKLTATTAGSDGSDANVKHLVQMREQARASKDWAQSDRIRDDLKALGVELFDKEKMWRAKSGASGCIIGYRGSAGPTDMEISALVVQREKARQSSDYNTADMVRDELRAVGVEIMDKEKIWRASDGRTGPVPAFAAIAASSGGGSGSLKPSMLAKPTGTVPSVPGLSGFGGLSLGAGTSANVQVQVIQAALDAARDPATAARTLQLLQQASKGGGASRAPPSKAAAIASRQNPEAIEALNFMTRKRSSGQTTSDAEIDWLMGIREKLRHAKDFAGADQMRDAFRNTLGVELFEKEKRWQANDGRQGNIPTFTSLGL